MAISSSSIVATAKAKNGRALVDEKIDERILRILGLDDVFDIDYDTYASLLRERMASARMSKQTLPTEEVEMITDEWKRVKGKKGRFKVKKINATSFKKGTAVGINLGKQKLLPGIKPLSLPPSVGKMSGGDDLSEIRNLLAEIIKNLTQQNKSQKESSDRARKEGENVRRALAESKLEKGFKLAIKAAEKIIAPIKSLLSRIIDFFMAIFWGKVFLKLLDWFADENNKKKIQSLFRFFGDHWPKLLALYLRFGTGLGKFVGGFTKLVFFGTRKLLQVVAQMLGAKAAARFLGGRGGRLVSAGLQVATTVGTTMALSGGIEKFVGGDEKEEKPKTAKFSGGGLANFKKLFGFFGGGPGHVTGEKGVDKIPAMLSDGEFVMSRGAVQKYGVSTLEAMNASGGGTNRPRMISGVHHAAGGGLINPVIGGSLTAMGNAADTGLDISSAIGSKVVSPVDGKLEYLEPGHVRQKDDANPKMPGHQNQHSVRIKLNSPFKMISEGADWKGKKNINVKYFYATHMYDVNKKLQKSANSPSIPITKNTFLGLSGQARGTPHIHVGFVQDPDVHEKGFLNYKAIRNLLMNRTNSKAADNVNAENKTINSPTSSSGPFERLSQFLQVHDLSFGKIGNPPVENDRPKSKYAKGGKVIFPQLNKSKEFRYEGGGMGGSSVKLSKSPRLNNISPPSRPELIVTTFNRSGGTNMPISGTPGTPIVPSFSTKHPDTTSYIRRLKISGIA